MRITLKPTVLWFVPMHFHLDPKVKVWQWTTSKHSAMSNKRPIAICKREKSTILISYAMNEVSKDPFLCLHFFNLNSLRMTQSKKRFVFTFCLTLYKLSIVLIYDLNLGATAIINRRHHYYIVCMWVYYINRCMPIDMSIPDVI